MKQKLLLKSMLLLCALVAGSSSVWAGDVTITISTSSFTDLPTSGNATYGTYSWSQGGISGKATICANSNSTNLQFNSSNRLLYNTSAIPGKIKSIKLTTATSTTARAFVVYGSTSAYSGSGDSYGTQIGSSQTVSTSGTTYTVSSGEYNYFVTRLNASNAAYLSKVEITYTPSHTLSYSATNGSIAGVDAGSKAVVSGASVLEGATVTLTATPSSGYYFSGWSVNGTGSTLSSPSTNPTTFTMGTANATVTANFEAIVGDYITPSPTSVNVANTGDVAEFEMSTNIATPNYDLTFYTSSTGDETTTKPTWLGDYEFAGNTLDIEVNENTGGTERSAYFKVYSGSTYSPMITITQDALVIAAPTFSPVAGIVATGTEITLIQAAADEIRYTLDGTDPTKTTGIVYSSPIVINTPTTIKAIAIKGEVVSAVAEASYTPVAVTLDLSSNTDWGFPSGSSNKTTTSNTFTQNGYSIILDNGYYFDNNNLLLGKTNATLTLPAFGFNVSQIKVYGTSGSSASVTFNIYVGNTPVSTEVTSSKVTQTFDINSEYQAVGTIYTIKVTNDNNMRITKIEIYGNGCEAGLVTSYGWATYITTADVQYPANTAFVVTDASVSGNSGTLTMEEVTQVPSGTPLLLKGEGAKTAISLDAAPAAPATNLLSVSNGSFAAGEYPYVLAKDGEGACFKYWTGTAATLNGRVVLLLDESIATAPVFTLDTNETTGINAVNGSEFKVNGEYYNLAGQRVANPTKGLYIVNGKKVIIK